MSEMAKSAGMNGHKHTGFFSFYQSVIIILMLKSFCLIFSNKTNKTQNFMHNFSMEFSLFLVGNFLIHA